MLRDLNEGQPDEIQPAIKLQALFDPAGPLISCHDLDGFDLGSRPGTYDLCAIR